jgi:hypothetical protein
MLNWIARPGRARVINRMLWLGIMAAALSWGCDDKGTDPEDVNYNIYIGASYYRDSTAASRTDLLYLVSADSLTLLDSIPLPSPTYLLAVSPDGRWVYVTGAWGGSPQSIPAAVRKIDVQTKQEVWSHEGSLLMTLLDDGEHLLHGLDVLRTSDGFPVQQIDVNLRRGDGPMPGSKIAAVFREPGQSSTADTNIVLLDVLTGDTSGHYVPRLLSGEVYRVFYVTLHQDQRRVLAITFGGQYNSWLVVGDIETGETLFQDHLYSPYGSIAISANGSLAAATDPGQPAIGGTPVGINIVDLDAMQPLKRFDEQSGLYFKATGQAHFLPGDQKLVAAPPAGMFAGGGPLCIIDLTSMTVTDTIWPVTHGWGGALGLGVEQKQD